MHIPWYELLSVARTSNVDVISAFDSKRADYLEGFSILTHDTSLICAGPKRWEITFKSKKGKYCL